MPQKIDLFYVALGLFIGILIVYSTSSKPTTIIKYPTLENINNTTYVDEDGQCYRYTAKEVKCDV